MTREELRHDFHNEHGINWENSQGEPDIDYVMWLEDKLLPLPPAEGAEQKCVEQNRYETCINPHEILYRGCTDKCKYYATAQQQPTAEGAEEMPTEEQFTAIIKATCEDVWYGRRSLDPVKEQTELIVKKVYPLFTLHAQRMAEKMVSDRLREELIKYEIYWNFVLKETAEKIVDEYLKTRKK